MKNLLLVVLAISVSTPLLAQQGRAGFDGLEFVAPLQIAIGHDENFLVDRAKPDEKLLFLSLPPSVQSGLPNVLPQAVDDEFLVIRMPTIGYQHDGRRHEFVATWVPEFEIFKHFDDQNAFNHQATFGFSYFPARNIQIAVGDYWLSSHDPARTLQNAFVLLPRGLYKENSIRGGIDFQPNKRTSVGVRYDNAYNSFGQTDPFQARILDTRAEGYTFYVARMIGRNQRLRAQYSFFKRFPVNRAREFDDAVDDPASFSQRVHGVGVQYRAGINRTTVVNGGFGLARRSTDVDYTFRGGIEKRFAGVYFVSAGFARTLGFFAETPTGFAQGLRGSAFDDVITFRFRGEPTAKTAILFDTTLYRAAGNSLDSRDGFLGRVRSDYRLSDRNVVFASWESFHQSRNLYVLSPLSRNRFAVGIEISLSSEAQRRNSAMNDDDLYVSLTDRARRRRAGTAN